jgi:ATP-dependent helicase/nuclease subunit A
MQENYSRNELNSYLLDDESKGNEYSKYNGKLIHYILSKNISKENLAKSVRQHIKNTFKEVNYGSQEDEILNELYLFYDSKEFEFINSFPNYKNEFEVYLKMEDYYLFGILDKLVFADKKLIIIDYKTDNIDKAEINIRSEKYLPQLNFYSYIISRFFNKKHKIEGRLIFINYPENPIVINYDEVLDKQIKSALKEMVNSLRNNKYSVNLNACKECIFADDNLLCINQATSIN